ncbi:MAG: hypothetical protein WC669_04465 [Patescibacteria group bacterium]|jgi:hypothetical protein
MAHKIAQLSIHDLRHAHTTGEIFVQPDPGGQNLGVLLILLELATNTPADQELMRLFLEIAYNAYEQSQLHQPEKKLENILAALNQELPAQAAIINKTPAWKSGKTKLPIGINCFVGLAEDNNLYFSTYGKIFAYLIRPTLIKKINEPTAEANGQNMFDFTLNGALQPDDRLLIASQSVLDYLSLEKIKKIISTLPPQSSSAHMTNILEAAPKSASFFALILQTVAAEKSSLEAKTIPLKTANVTGSKKSIDQMLLTQAETEKILTPPSFWQSIKDKITEQLAERKKNSVRTKNGQTILNNPALEKINQPDRPYFSTLIKTSGLKKFTTSLKPLLKIWLILLDPQERQQAGSRLAKKAGSVINYFNRLSKNQKIAIVSVIVLTMFFSESLIWQTHRTEKNKQEQFYQTTVAQINGKKNDLEAALIYKDAQRTKEILAEILNLANSLPLNNPVHLSETQKIKSEANALMAKVWKITEIPEPLSLINLREINLTAEMKSLNFKDDYLFAFGNQNQIIAVNVNTSKPLILDNLTLAVNKSALFPKIKNLILSTQDNKFFTLENNQIIPLIAQLPVGLTQIDDLTFYLDKMYLLDRQAKQIFRLTYSGGEFKNPVSWLKESLPVEQITSLAVDGVIYAMQDNGQILKLASGKKEGEIKPILEPELNKPAKIYTDENSQYLYILDQANKRLVVLDKQGEVIAQYHSEKFSNLKDLIVREKDKKAYLLNDSQIYVIALQP